MRKLKTQNEVAKINREIYNLRYYYKENYGLKELGLTTITDTRKKTAKEIRGEIRETVKKITSIKVGIKESKKEIEELSYIELTPKVRIKRKTYNRYNKALDKENMRKRLIAEEVFSYLTETGRNKYKSVEELMSNQLDLSLTGKLNARGYDQEYFEKTIENRLKRWSNEEDRRDTYMTNITYAVAHSDLDVTTQELLLNTLAQLSESQLSALANSETLLSEVAFKYEYESLGSYDEQYRELIERIKYKYLNE